MLFFFVPDATFTQQFIMYSFFIATPILIVLFVVFLAIKSVKQNNESRKCPHCAEFVGKNDENCRRCGKDLGEILE